MSHPQKVHATHSILVRYRVGIKQINMIYSNDTGIPIAMLLCTADIVGRKEDNVAVVCFRVDCVLSSPHIVRRVVDAQDVMLIHGVVLEIY
jgi:hypothetical protein